MQGTANTYLDRRPVLMALVTLLIAFGVFIAWAGKGPSFRLLTLYHGAAGNYFFRYITHLGDGIFILALAALLALRKHFFLTIGIVSGYLLSGIFAQLGKKLLNLPRPKAWFQTLGEQVYEVPGVEVHLSGSFPSGHTASVFALMVFLILALPYRRYSWLLLLVAAVVGYSRIYLSQHFPIDVWAGACIGACSGWLVYHMLHQRVARKV